MKKPLLGRVCGEMLSLCGASPQGLYKAPHDSGVCWKQFMVLLEEVLVCGGVSCFISRGEVYVIWGIMAAAHCALLTIGSRSSELRKKAKCLRQKTEQVQSE